MAGVCETASKLSRSRQVQHSRGPVCAASRPISSPSSIPTCEHAVAVKHNLDYPPLRPATATACRLLRGCHLTTCRGVMHSCGDWAR